MSELCVARPGCLLPPCAMRRNSQLRAAQLLTTHNSQFTTHNSQFTTHRLDY
jgi:hypothetical protein